MRTERECQSDKITRGARDFARRTDYSANNISGPLDGTDIFGLFLIENK